MHSSITTITGEPGTIKSSIAITYPGPIAFYNLEGGGHRAWGYADAIARGDLIERVFPLPAKSITERWAPLTGHLEVWKDITQQLEKDFDQFPTVVLDTGTIMWALDRDAYLQELQITSPTRKQLLQIEFGEPNRRMNGIYNLARGFQKNLVVVHHETDEYMQVMDPMGKPIMNDGTPLSVTTGRKVPEGFKHTIALSDWVLHTELRDNVPWMTVEKSGYGLQMRGKEIDWPTYDKLDALVSETIPQPVPVEVPSA